MAQALYFAVLLSMLLCFASGQDFSIDCPKPMKMATPNYNENVTITCSLKKSAFTAVCSGSTLPSQVQFQLTTSKGSELPWCYAGTSPCPSDGAVQSTGSSLPSRCGCVTDDGTYMTFTMTIRPTLDVQGGTFTCEAACLPAGSSSLPALVDKSDRCTNIPIVDPCGGCGNDEGCDEETLTCITKEICNLACFICLIIFLLIFLIISIISTIAAIWIYTSKSTNEVHPKVGSSAPLSTSRRELPVPSTKPSTAAPRLDPIDHGKTNMATDETNPGGQLFPKKLEPIPSGGNCIAGYGTEKL